MRPGDEHFVRMLEPIMLVDMGSRHRNRHLARLADTLQVCGRLGLCRALLTSGWVTQALHTKQVVMRGWGWLTECWLGSSCSFPAGGVVSR